MTARLIMKTANAFMLLLFTALFANTVFADNLGVLFTTPEQRAALDADRGSHGVDKKTSGPAVVKARPATITLNGTLISSVGKKEVWLNGHPSFEGKPRSTKNLRLLGKNRIRLNSASASKSHILKPGQVIDLESGRIDEVYNRAP